jgi:1,4-alpha-glucan branching enzyme
MPGLAARIDDGGIGFDFRMAMGIPDFWIKYIKEVRDEDWRAGHIFWELTNRRADEKTISYAESHDQALVGDKTIIFRLIDAEMYWHMQKGDNTLTVDRGVALHKMIRLITATTINGGYLNFMGNEFGHPEWIDFPREGNGWSYKFARRQWELADNELFLYHDLGCFDRDMIAMLKSINDFNNLPIQQLWDNDGDQVVAYQRGDYVFAFNFNGEKSFTDYGILADRGACETLLTTDNSKYGGFNRIDESIVHFTVSQPVHESGKEWLMLYLPARTAIVLKRKQ